MGRAKWGMALVLSAGMMCGVVVRAEAQVPRGVAGVRVPPGHRPGPGQCRVWYPGVPPGHQPAAFRCDAPGVYRHGGVVPISGPWGREAFLLVGEVRRIRRVRVDYAPIRFRLAASGSHGGFQWVAELGYRDSGRDRGDRVRDWERDHAYDYDRYFRVDDRRRDKPGRGRGHGRGGRGR